MMPRYLLVLYIVCMTMLVSAQNNVYGIGVQNMTDGKITFVGKISLMDVARHMVSEYNYVKLFLPKDPISFHLDKNKAQFLHVPKNVYSFPVTKHLQASVASIPSIAGGFEGLNQTQCNCVPPDVQVATGPMHVVEAVNADVGIWNKNGTSVSTTLISRIFSIPDSDVLSDPRVIFDSLSMRWYLSILDVTASNVGVAVSATDDPTKSWNVYSIKFDGNCPDQPIIGMSTDKFVVSANDFTNCTENPSFLGAQFFVINKSDLMAGTNNPSMQKFGPDSSEFSIFPAQQSDPAPTLFMASAYGANNVLEVYSLSGSVPNVNVAKKDIPIQNINMPPGAAQYNTRLTVDTTDDRIQSAVLKGGHLWAGLNDGCTPQGDTQARSCVRIMEIDTAQAAALQDFDIAYNGFYYFYPALTVDSQSRLNLGFGYSSASDYPGLMYAVQNQGSSVNTIEKPQIFKQGSWYDSTGRYGDYFGASPDSPDGKYAWFAGEYHAASSPMWSTFIATTNPVVVPEFQYSILALAAAMFLLIVPARALMKSHMRA